MTCAKYWVRTPNRLGEIKCTPRADTKSGESLISLSPFIILGRIWGNLSWESWKKSSKTSWNINFQPKTFLTADENFIKMTCAKYWVRTPNRTRRNKIHNARRHECLGISPVWTHNLEYPWSWRLTDPGFPKISEIHPTLMSSISELRKDFFKISKDF